jgi:hypothetical protein
MVEHGPLATNLGLSRIVRDYDLPGCPSNLGVVLKGGTRQFKVIVPVVRETAPVGRHSEAGTTPMTPSCFAANLRLLCTLRKRLRTRTTTSSRQPIYSDFAPSPGFGPYCVMCLKFGSLSSPRRLCRCNSPLFIFPPLFSGSSPEILCVVHRACVLSPRSRIPRTSARLLIITSIHLTPLTPFTSDYCARILVTGKASYRGS